MSDQSNHERIAPEAHDAQLDTAAGLAAQHAERLPSRLPRWHLDGTLFAALSTAVNDLRPSMVTRDAVTGFMIDSAEQRFALVQMDAIPYDTLAVRGMPWVAEPVARERVHAHRQVGARWDAIDGLRFVACLLESQGCIAGPIELRRRYKMVKWPDLGALPTARAILRPYLRHATALARGNRSIGEVLAGAGNDWREALAFANACAMLDLLLVVEE